MGIRKREREERKWRAKWARMTDEERAEHDAKIKDMSDAFHYWTRERLSRTEGANLEEANVDKFHEFLRNEWPSLKERGQHMKWDVKCR